MVVKEGDHEVMRWPVDQLRSGDAPPGVVRVVLADPRSLPSIDVPAGDVSTGFRDLIADLQPVGGQERTSRIVFWSMAAAASVLICALVIIPLIAERLTPLVPAWLEHRVGATVDRQFRLIFDEQVCDGKEGEAALAKLTAALQRSAPSAPRVEVMVISSDVENAFALPGGRIYLFEGLLGRAENADEIAGVLAHEMGHVANRDGLRVLLRSSGASFLLGLLFGDITGGASIVIGGQLLIDSSYSRDAESKADAFSGRTMQALGRPATAMPSLLSRVEDDGESRLPVFLSSHPMTKHRERHLAEYEPAETGPEILTPEEWRALQQVCTTP
jgi:predicted Zn-dependent protease